MARARLVGPIRARKATECDFDDKPIKVGEMKFVVEAFRMRRSFCVAHKPTPEQVDGMAPKSRADRASDVAGDLNDTASQLNDIAGDLRTAVEKNDKRAEDAQTTESGPETDAVNDPVLDEECLAELDDIRIQLEKLGPDWSEVESLADEMRTWADNTEEHFGSTSKWDEVSSAADELEGLTEPSGVPSWPADLTRESIDGLADECESVASEMEEAAGELENVNFPSMF